MQDIDVTSIGFDSEWFRPALMQRPHRHNEVEINFLEAGSLTYLSAGGRTRIVTGQIALFWATIPHQVVQVEDAAILHWVTVPFATFLRWQLPDVLTQDIIRGKFVLGNSQGTGQSYDYEQQFRQWYYDLKSSVPELRKIVALEIEACLRRLALTLPVPIDAAPEQVAHLASDTIQPARSQDSREITPAGELSRVERMASFIAEHYTEPLPVAVIAREVHLHPNYAMSLFHKNFAISIVDYITQYRVAHAQRLLITSDLNTSQIALEAGFGSVSRFYTAFKATCGKSPGEYRASLALP